MLHDFGIVHRDISPENIVLDSLDNGVDQSWKVRLIDFGVASCERWCTGGGGKRALEAPEIHRGDFFDAFLTDAFALGVVLFAMAAKDYPWSSTKPEKCAFFEFVVKHGLRKHCEKRAAPTDKSRPLIQMMSPSCLGLIEGLLQLEPSKRIALGETCWSGCRTSALESDWFLEEATIHDGLT
jgi:serine/threonine protein kinase